MERFRAGDWVVVPPHGVGRVARITDKSKALPGRRAYVVVVDAAGIELGDRDSGVAQVQESQLGAELVIPVDGVTEKAMRAIVSRDRALELRAALAAPLDPARAPPTERYAFLQTALAGDLTTAVDHLRTWRANPPVASFVERRAIAALQRVVEGELAIALGEPSWRVRALHAAALEASAWSWEVAGGQTMIRIVAADRSSRLLALAPDEHDALKRLLEAG